MKTLADFKREASKKIFTLVNYRNSESIPLHMQGERKVTKVQTNAIQLENTAGKKSWLDLPKAKLLEYTGDRLKIYEAGYRDLKADEKSVVDRWNQVTTTYEYKQLAETDMMSDTNHCYWKMKQFFDDAGYTYLNELGNYNWKENKIRDESVKGNLILEYILK